MGKNTANITEYIKEQWKEDEELDEMRIDFTVPFTDKKEIRAQAAD